jgi:hypothetical protein
MPSVSGILEGRSIRIVGLVSGEITSRKELGKGAGESMDRSRFQRLVDEGAIAQKLYNLEDG